MKVLEALGIVEIRHGFGTYVGGSTLTALESGLRFRAERSLHEGLAEIRELLDVREVLEVGLMDRVVTVLTDADLAALAEVVAEMAAAAERGEHFENADWRFHEGLYRPLDNHLVVDLLRVFWDVFHQVEPGLPGARYTPAAAAGWHRDILAALVARDVERARAAMSAHFSDIRERLGR
jgi:DNA-binding FadR family transcriptional regulator